ncbi:MAG: AAA family ATPase [Alphaproteobacteria bacterium]|nr:AAA family ATPase [Alphaproteobacteria bacterium]NCQ66447.1 AAA family ATPase [Alphaproteobacteria bacterium]
MNLSLNEAPQELLDIITRHNRAPLDTETPSSHFNNKSSLSSEDVQHMLSFLDPDMPYGDWLKIGMAIQSGGYGLSIWDDWSAKGNKYKTGECQSKWKGFDGSGGVSFGTLVHMAKQAGYAPQETLNLPMLKLQDAERKKPSFKIHHWSTLGLLPQRKYLIKGLLEQGGMSVVFGASNSGKTFVALDISCHIALGWEWCGRKLRKGAVVYVAAEGGLGIAERLTAFRKLHDLDKYADVYVVPSNVCLCKEESTHEELLEAIQGIPNVKLIVVDTLARAMGAGDENGSSDMGSFIQNCDIMRQKTNAHVMVIHHSGKSEGRGARGHSSLKAAIDTEIQVSQDKGLIKAEITKQRDGRTGYNLNFALREYEVRKDEDDEPVHSCALVNVEGQGKLSSLSGQARTAYTILEEFILEAGVEYVPQKKGEKKKAVRIEDYRTRCREGGLCETDNKDSFIKAFKRVRETLVTEGYTEEWEGYIWITDKLDKTGQTKRQFFAE